MQIIFTPCPWAIDHFNATLIAVKIPPHHVAAIAIIMIIIFVVVTSKRPWWFSIFSSQRRVASVLGPSLVSLGPKETHDRTTDPKWWKETLDRTTDPKWWKETHDRTTDPKCWKATLDRTTDFATYLYIMARCCDIPVHYGKCSKHSSWLLRWVYRLALKEAPWQLVSEKMFLIPRIKNQTDLSFSRTLPWRFRRHIAALQKVGFKVKSDQDYKIIQFTFGRVGFELSCIAIAKTSRRGGSALKCAR